ncbi:TetR family transcriptional regulator [Streptacidiphilus sp. 4-A2]|nr:TetR family transcriptional regulator [Streptacidiphilus sp. 4-A2]
MKKEDAQGIRSGGRFGRQVEAERNDALVLEAARAVFAEQGADAPVSAIAERAGVGIGTLYRRYGSKEQLIQRLCAIGIARTISDLSSALDADGTGWDVLARYMTAAVDARVGAFAPWRARSPSPGGHRRQLPGPGPGRAPAAPGPHRRHRPPRRHDSRHHPRHRDVQPLPAPHPARRPRPPPPPGAHLRRPPPLPHTAPRPPSRLGGLPAQLGRPEAPRLTLRPLPACGPAQQPGRQRSGAFADERGAAAD